VPEFKPDPWDFWGSLFRWLKENVRKGDVIEYWREPYQIVVRRKPEVSA